jgi:hypothetical protein
MLSYALSAVLFAEESGVGGVTFVYVGVGIVVGAVVGAIIGSFKGRTGLGLILGALLGCIGWLIVAILPRK